jgi:outer membrane beta-barrel protein
MHTTLRWTVGCLAALCLTQQAYAQDDDLSDILGSDTSQTAGQERRSLEEEADAPGVEPLSRKEALIKTLQRKTFVKINRYEMGPQLGFVTNDPFLNRYLGGVRGAYHVTEVLGIEGSFIFSPELDGADEKAITKQLEAFNQVTPDISKIQYAADMNVQFSPIYGKVAMFGKNIINFDIFGSFGTGIVRTADDLEKLDAVNDQRAVATQGQIHPSLTYGGGVRVVFSEGFAVRMEAKGFSYIEVLESTTLEMKNNMALLVSASWFAPRMN